MNLLSLKYLSGKRVRSFVEAIDGPAAGPDRAGTIYANGAFFVNIINTGPVDVTLNFSGQPITVIPGINVELRGMPGFYRDDIIDYVIPATGQITVKYDRLVNKREADKYNY